jgi:hypothetical protein
MAILDTILLTALPASGKSEVRRYLALQDPQAVASSFHMGPTVQLDDYPYVHIMRRISEELVELGQPPVFFSSTLEPFSEPRDWGTLVALINEDYRDLRTKPRLNPDSAAGWLFDRLDAARAEVGAAPALGNLPADVRKLLEATLEKECRTLLEDKLAGIPNTLDGKTIVIEFARGGAQGSAMPLKPPFGYAYSFSCLSDEILERASVLYIWVTPEESRRKNEERAKPGRDGDASILNHGVPIKVMLGDYGTDDMGWLIENSDRPGTVRIETRARGFHLPVARFDNRADLTTFIREEPEHWPVDKTKAVHAELSRALTELAAAPRG